MIEALNRTRQAIDSGDPEQIRIAQSYLERVARELHGTVFETIARQGLDYIKSNTASE